MKPKAPFFLLSTLPFLGSLMLFVQIFRGKMFTGEKLRKPAQNALRQVPVWSWMIDAAGLASLLFFLAGLLVWMAGGIARVIFLSVLYSPWVSKVVFEIDLTKKKADAEAAAAMGQAAQANAQSAEEGQMMEEQVEEEEEGAQTASIRSKKEGNFQSAPRNVAAFNQSPRNPNQIPSQPSNVISMAPQNKPNPNSIPSKKPQSNLKKAA